MANADTAGNPLLDKKRTIIILQWLIVIASCYLMLFGAGEVSDDRRVYGLVVIFLISALALYSLSEDTFQRPFFDAVLLVSDTLLVSVAIYMSRDGAWDLLLFYFLILFLAAIGESMLRIVSGSVIVSLIYIALLLQQGKEFSQLGTALFIRIPFLFGVSILYGFLAENANRERRRAEMAEHRERLKMDLVSSLAHDIKNPLGIIMGYTEMMMEAVENHPQETEERDLLGRIQENAYRIDTLVTGFLDAIKAEVGKLDMAQQPVSINELLIEAARQQEPHVRKQGLTLELKLDEQLPEVSGDKTQLDRVFWNLFSNAIKFTPPGGKITVTSKHHDRHACVSVQDTGIGIPQDELPLLFSQFRRLEGGEKTEGTGLGLFIVKTIIEAHKGKVQVDSVDGQGSTFTVRVPIRS